MPRRPDSDVLSPRAMARLRAPRTGYVPTARELDRDPRVARTADGPGSGAVAGRGPDAVAGGGPDAVVGEEPTEAPTLRHGAVGARAEGPRSGRHGDRLPGRRWVTLPVALEGARWQPGRSAVLGIVVLTLLAVAVFGLRVARAQSDEDSRVIAPGGGSRAGPTGVAAGAAPVGVPVGAGSGDAGGAGGPSAASGSHGLGTAAASAVPGGALVVVHVVGQVRSPGVLRLAAGSRVADALEAAGGPTRDADLARVNLARLLVDGEQVQVPAPGDPDPVVGGAAAGGPAAGSGGGGTGAGAGTAASPTRVSLNTADLAALESLPGIGPVLAQRILDWRVQHGRFSSVEELGEVSGIGEKLLAQLTALVTL